VALACAAAALVATAGASSRPAAQTTGLIAYWSDSPWPSIWRVRPDGSHRKRILRNRQNAKRPSLSPDRKWVVFDGAPPGTRPISDFEVQIVRLDGSGRRTLTNTPERNLDAQWSPDGKSLSFSRMPEDPPDTGWLESRIWIMDSDGTDTRVLVRGMSARWSPDGTQLVFAAATGDSDGDLFVIGTHGSGLRRLSATRAIEQPAGWFPDGTTILFTRYATDGSNRSSVFVMNADGTGVRRLARGVAGAWSPDGTRILYASTFLGGLHVMRRNGSHKLALRVRGADPSWR